MIRRLRERLTYANVTATIAVFIALGGTSYAAVKLPRNSVDSTHIKSGSVRSVDVKDRSLEVRDLSRKAREALRGQRGPAGPQGPAGGAGTQGAAGASGGPGTSTSTSTSGPTALTLTVKQATVSATKAPNPDETAVSTGSVSCDAGQRIVSGGVRLEAPGATSTQDSYPAGGAAWTARVGNDDPAAAHDFTVYAICTP